jgi:hypothetical protein
MGHSTNGFYQFLSGTVMFGAGVAGVFFFKFWSKTRDRLFLLFGIGFWLFALERIPLALMNDPTSENNSHVYLIRLAGFILILYAIFDKNRSEHTST